MKKTLIAMISIVALVIAAGCENGTPCDEAAAVAEAATQEACSGKSDCQFCECLVNGQVLNSEGDGCEDAPGSSEPTTCEGAELTNAENCLDDRDACQAAFVTILQPGIDAACM